MAMKLRRTVATYEACSPNAIASGSKAQMMYFVEDAQKDIGTLADTLTELREAAKRVLAGLDARIDRSHPSSVPVFDGIAELHDAIGKAVPK